MQPTILNVQMYFLFVINLSNIIVLKCKKTVDTFCSSIVALLDKTGKKDALKKLMRSGRLH